MLITFILFQHCLRNPKAGYVMYLKRKHPFRPSSYSNHLRMGDGWMHLEMNYIAVGEL